MPKIVLIMGPPASGKSTIARLLAQHFPKSLHLQVDRLREMMVNGALMPDGPWTDEVTQQFLWARSSAVYMAQLYAGQGVVTMIDDAAVPAGFAEHYAGLDSYPETHRVLLLPTAAALIKRLEKRAGPYDHVLVNAVPWIYSYLEPMPKAGWLVLDSSNWTIDQTVQEALRGIGATNG